MNWPRIRQDQSNCFDKMHTNYKENKLKLRRSLSVSITLMSFSNVQHVNNDIISEHSTRGTSRVRTGALLGTKRDSSCSTPQHVVSYTDLRRPMFSSQWSDPNLIYEEISPWENYVR
jgi:hypothetical protein